MRQAAKAQGRPTMVRARKAQPINQAHPDTKPPKISQRTFKTSRIMVMIWPVAPPAARARG